MIARSRFLSLFLTIAVSLGLSACDPNGTSSDCEGAMGCQNERKATTFHEWAGLDTLVLPESMNPLDSVLAVVSIPAGCGYLDSVFQDRRGDTLVIRPRVFYHFYEGVPCAHGPAQDSVHLGVAGHVYQGATKVAYLRTRRGTWDTTLVRPVPLILRP